MMSGKKTFRTAVFFMTVLSLTAGCKISFATGDESKTSIPEDIDSGSGSSFTVDSDSCIYINLTDAKCSDDNSTWTSISTSKTKLLNETASVKFTEDDSGNSTGLIKIDLSEVTENSAVYLSGTLTSGGVKISTPEESTNLETGIYLNGVTIKSSNYPCIAAVNGGTVTVTLVDGTSSTLTDGRSFGTGYGEEYSTSSSDTYTDDDGNTCSCTVVKAAVQEGSDAKGTLYSKGSMTLCGSGSLTVSEGYKNCIASKGLLVVEDGTYSLTSTGKCGLFGDYGVKVSGGDITFNGTGAVSSSAYHKAHGINVNEDDYADSYIKITGGTLSLTAYDGKGMTAPYIYISGGTTTVNSTGVTGYTSDDNKKASYYDADGVYYSNTSVVFAAEGIEGGTACEITGGTVEVTATDDAFNVSTTGGSFKLSSGSIYAYSSSGDGIDCNGSIYISGGTVMTCAPTGSEDGLDCGDGSYSISISGGLIASLSGSSQGSSSISASNCVVVNYTGSSSSSGGFGGRAAGQSSSSSLSGTTVVVKDSSSNLLYALTCPSVSGSSSFSLLTMASPNFTSTGTYTIYKGASVSGGTSFNGLYTTLPSVSSTGSSAGTVSVSSTSGSYSSSSSSSSSSGFGR